MNFTYKNKLRVLFKKREVMKLTLYKLNSNAKITTGTKKYE